MRAGLNNTCLECIPGYSVVNNQTCEINLRYSPLIKKGSIICFKPITMNSTNSAETTDLLADDMPKRCIEAKEGVCQKCASSFMLDNNSNCAKNLQLLNKIGEQSSFTASSGLIGSKNWWIASGKLITPWILMRWKNLYRVWGFEITPNASVNLSISKVYVFYELENGKEMCYRDCQPTKLSL